MKKLTQILLLVNLLAITTHVKSQVLTQTCAGSPVTITATNPSGLTSVSYSLQPGNLISLTPNFVVTPTITTTYTVYTSGLNASSQMVTTSNTVAIGILRPSYNVVSPQNFTLGCGASSVAVISIINGSATNSLGIPNGGVVTYTLMPPGSFTIPTTFSLSSITNYTVATAGAYTVVVRDIVSFCTATTQVVINANTSIPTAGNVSISPTPLNCTNSTATLEVNMQPNRNYVWLPMAATGGSITVNSIPTANTSSIAATVTLQISDINSNCVLDTVIKVLQNCYKPNAAISDGTQQQVVCSPTLILTNVSFTGIPLGTFPATQAVAGQLWMGPAPQTNSTMSATYLAQTTGIYTLIAIDLNNNCTDTATFVVNVKPGAAFTHTVSGANVSFSSITSGVGAGTTYLWNFGDGVTSTLQNPLHTYSSAGSHVVQLKVKNNVSLCVDSTSTSIAISGIPCVANSSFALVPTATAQVWNAIPAYPYNIIAAQWSWGDGSISNVLYTSHQYASAGLYNICLTVTVSCVGTSSSCTSYSVYRATQAMQMTQVNVVAPELATSLAELKVAGAEKWQVSPNPGAGLFSLEATTLLNSETNIQVFDYTGKLVVTKNLVKGELSSTLDLTEFPAGIYQVSCSVDGTRDCIRLVLTK